MILNVRAAARRGITLIEVLTAIFILGIGLLAILTLFPLGALNMARAVREDRAAAIGGNAAALANAIDLRNDNNVVTGMTSAPAGFLPPDPNGPSYPVFVDPVYFVLPGGSTIGYSGAAPPASPGLPRVIPASLTTAPPGVPQSAARFTFLDEIAFEKTGQATGGGLAVNRPGAYNWAYLIRRPRSSSAALTETSIVVYANRANDAPAGETVIYNSGNALGAAGTTSLSFPSALLPSPRPNLRKGGWILDGSYQTYGTGGMVNGYFYQIASISEAGGTVALDLETPLKANVTTLVLLDNVITVLDRGAGWKP